MILLREEHFTSESAECTVCSSELRAYKTKRRNVMSADMGGFVAVEHMKYCEDGHPRIIFRSGKLKHIVNGYCTYANDVIVPAAAMCFIDSRSCGEIARAMDIGISERHVRRLSSTALEVFANMHGCRTSGLTSVSLVPGSGIERGAL